jgi:hypothetical protein
VALSGGAVLAVRHYGYVSDMELVEGSFEITTSRAKTARYTVFCAVILVVYIVIWWAGILVPVVTIAGVVVFGSVLVLGVVQLIRKPVTLVTLNAEGAHFGNGGGFLPWRDLRCLRIARMRPRFLFWARPLRLLVFVPTDPAAIISEPRKGLRRLQVQGLARRLYGSALVLMQDTFDESVEDVVEHVHAFADVPVERD